MGSLTRRALLLVAVALAGYGYPCCRASVSDLVSDWTVAVDYAGGAAVDLAPFDFRYGVDHGPECASACLRYSAGKCVEQGPAVNVAPELLAMGASLIRTHDSGVLDWPVVFPHSLALQRGSTTADTTDPSNYVWGAADAYYGNIVESGMEAYLRLGTSWGQQQGGLPPAGVEYNRTALVDVLLHTVMHYNAGWGGGTNFSGVGAGSGRFLEVWNEPDSSCVDGPGGKNAGCGRFWNRSSADFFDLVDDTVRAIKAYDPSLQVGADGVAGARTTPTTSRPHPKGYIRWNSTDIVCSKISGPCNLGTDVMVASLAACESVCNSTSGCAAFVGWASPSTPDTPFHCQLKYITGPGTGDASTRSTYVRVPDSKPNPYSWGLIAELGRRKTPVDFFSWHGYVDQPEWYTDTAAAVQQHLQAAGLGHVKQHVTEWFPCILCPAQDTFAGAAAFAGTLTMLIDAGVTLATLYPACSLDEGNKTGGKGWGLFDIQTTPGVALWRPLTHTYAQFGELMQTTPYRLTAVVNGPRDAVFTVLAGRTVTPEPTAAAALKLMIASQHSNFSTVRVTVSGLPRLATMRYSVVLTNQSVVSGGIAQASPAGAVKLPPFEAASPAVAFVRIEQEMQRDSASKHRPKSNDVHGSGRGGTKHAWGSIKHVVPECLITAKIYEGGAVADNATVNTHAIQAAIDGCHTANPEGARVVVPAGAFRTGSLMLRSNLELHLAAGAGLYGSDAWPEYPIVPGLPFGTMFRALISGYNLTNVKVTGSNTAVPASGVPDNDSIIDGVGWSWWCIGHHMPVWPVAYCKHFNPANKTLPHGLLLPKLVELFNCSGVEIRDFTAQNSPFWTIVPTYSRDVTVLRMTVLNPRNVGQTDGIDPNSCVNCLVEDCHIDVGDDGVSIKAYDVIGVGPAPCSNVTIRRTNVVSRNICVGGATEGGVSNVLFEDVSVGDPNTVTSPWAIKFKVSTGLLRNVTFRRLKIGKIGNTPWMYPTRAPGDAFHIDVRPPPNATHPPPTMDGLTFEDISVVAVTYVGHISGPPAGIKNLTLKNITVESAGSGWGGCGNVDLTSFIAEDVSPPLKCN